MKRKSFIFSMGVAALLFAACSNDDNLMGGPAGNTPEQTIVEGVPTYATFTVKRVDRVNNTRATEAPEGETDNQIGDVTLLIFNNQTKVLENKFTIKHPATGVTTGTYLITSGKKRIFAFANLGASSGQTAIDGLKAKVSTVDDMLKLTTGEAGTALGQTNTTVPMSTPNDGLAKDILNGITETDAPTMNTVAIPMSRMIARAKLTLKAGMTNLVAKGFTANNIAKATYIVQSAVGGVVKSPLYEKTWGTTAGTNITAADFMAKENFYKADGTTPETINQLDKYYYLTENTSPSFLKGAATHFILKAVYLPRRIITGASFSVATQNLIYTYNNSPKEGDCGAYCFVTASPKTDVIPAQEYFSNAAVLSAAIAAYNTGINDANKNITVSDVKYTEYKKGSYYRINLGEGEDAENTVFGVNRNTSYTVTVNSATGPGFNDPEGNNGAEGNPVDPIDQKTYLNVTINVTPWTTASQNVDIN